MVLFTQSGATALLASKYRPHFSIIAFTPDMRICQRCALFRGVRTFNMEAVKDTDLLISRVNKVMQEHKLAKKGDHIAVIFGSPVRQMGFTNTFKLHIVGEEG